VGRSAPGPSQSQWTLTGLGSQEHLRPEAGGRVQKNNPRYPPGLSSPGHSLTLPRVTARARPPVRIMTSYLTTKYTSSMGVQGSAWVRELSRTASTDVLSARARPPPPSAAPLRGADRSEASRAQDVNQTFLTPGVSINSSPHGRRSRRPLTHPVVRRRPTFARAFTDTTCTGRGAFQLKVHSSTVLPGVRSGSRTGLR